jgi:hypothetical protein
MHPRAFIFKIIISRYIHRQGEEKLEHGNVCEGLGPIVEDKDAVFTT